MNRQAMAAAIEDAFVECALLEQATSAHVVAPMRAALQQVRDGLACQRRRVRS